MISLDIPTPRWASPLVFPDADSFRYWGAKGGRSSGKSHFFAERLVEKMVSNPDLQWVCIREIQKSLKFSAKKLIEDKIASLGVGHLFEVLKEEIRRKGGKGIIIFQGMQDHTAESIKSLEGFDGVWIEESQSLSARSFELLDPTIRKDGSQVWFSWNPNMPEDAVEKLFKDLGLNPESRDPQIKRPTDTEDGAILVHVDYLDNPWCPEVTKRQAARAKKLDYESYVHVWLGGYNIKSKAQIFSGKWRVDDFVPSSEWDGPYHGLDFGFSEDPTCAVRVWIEESADARRLYVEYDNGSIGLDLDKTAGYMSARIPGIDKYTINADSARPESISFLKKHGLPKITAVKKWPGSVEDGIEYLKTFDEIVIHSRCEDMQYEARMYQYKTNKAGEILPDVVDLYNHRWDAIRYALHRLIKSNRKTAGVW